MRRIGRAMMAALVILAAAAPPVAAYESRVKPPLGYALKFRNAPIRVHTVRSVAGICGHHRGLRTVGCAKRSATRCDIYIKRDPAPLTRREVLRHEKAHCKGWKHH